MNVHPASGKWRFTYKAASTHREELLGWPYRMGVFREGSPQWCVGLKVTLPPLADLLSVSATSFAVLGVIA